MANTPGKKRPSAWGTGRVAFLARQAAIRQALEEGWSMTAIFDRYSAEIGIGYTQFTRYVSRYLKADPTAKPAKPTQADQTAHPSPTTPPPAQEATPKPGPKRLDVDLPKFHWDPTPLRREDII